MCRLYVFVFLALAPFVSAADSINSSTENPDSSTFLMQEKLTGSFIQKRWLAVLAQPLVSTGSFSIEKNTAILWELKSPFTLTYDFDGNHLKVSEGGDVKSVNKKEDPMLYGFFAFFFKIFNLSYDEMKEWFDVSYAMNKGVRNITLLPKKSFMKKSFQKALVLESEGVIQSVTIFEAKGDKLQLQFSYEH